MRNLTSANNLPLFGTLLLQLSIHCSHGGAGDVDLSFDSSLTVADAVSVVVVQPDGKVLVGGPFTFINGTNRHASVRLNADGSMDGTFIPHSFNPDLTEFYGGPASYPEVAAIAVQPDGKVLVGGLVRYTCAIGEEGCQPLFRNFVTRLNASGSRDTNFTSFVGSYELAADQTPQVQTVALQPDGKIVVGYAGYGVVRGIVRLNPNGTQDTNFVTSVDFPGVYSVVAQADGKLLMAGSFSTVNGTHRNGIARLNSDGTLDNSFDPLVGGYPLALQPDGKVLVGGFARLNDDGSLDSSFNPGTGAYGVVRSMSLQADGKVVVGGGFTSIKGVARAYVARLYGDSIAPALNLTRSRGDLVLTWPVTAPNFQLQASTNLAAANAWSPVQQPAATNGALVSVTVPANADRKFFRLKSQ